jgi:hypothetical protein
MLSDTTTRKHHAQPPIQIMNMNQVWLTKIEHGVVRLMLKVKGRTLSLKPFFLEQASLQVLAQCIISKVITSRTASGSTRNLHFSQTLSLPEV